MTFIKLFYLIYYFTCTLYRRNILFVFFLGEENVHWQFWIHNRFSDWCAVPYRVRLCPTPQESNEQSNCTVYYYSLKQIRIFKKLTVSFCANQESGRADNHSLVLLFVEPRSLHANLRIASRTLCPNFADTLLLEPCSLCNVFRHDSEVNYVSGYPSDCRFRDTPGGESTCFLPQRWRNKSNPKTSRHILTTTVAHQKHMDGNSSQM